VRNAVVAPRTDKVPLMGRRRISRLDSVTLGPRLHALYAGFDHVDSAVDPVHIVRRYTRRDDREVVGFCAAGLAFGRVASVLQSVEALLALVGMSPAAYVRDFNPARERARLEPLGHRWVRGDDLTALMLVLQRMLRECESIEGFFLAGDTQATPDLSAALESFSTRAMDIDLRPAYGRVPQRPGVGYFFPRPSAGSACKRLNLFLRWMVRHDAIDLGTWTHVQPARLIVPLDTHIVRLGRCLRLTGLASPGWKMATEITASLRTIDAADPIRFDFALCHIGINGACGFGTRGGDANCPLKGHCHPGRRS
jgi:uncharacterized protein (TIGR02757 family)